MFENHYVLITKGSCEFCQEAIELLKSKELNFIYTDMENAPQVLEITKMASGHTTVPLIWEVAIGEDVKAPASNNFIGGCDELKKHLGVDSSGE
tara:strand:- start:2414 stop:2695 length:282 start_codon:yes stop_codon:yes gene_type:complete